jgi:opacity protein-like surface antigen
MTNIFRKSLLSGCVLAGAALAAGPALAAGETIAAQQQPAAAAAPATEVAQATPVEVIEVESPDGWYLTIGAGASWPNSPGWTSRRNNSLLLNNDLVPNSRVGGDLNLGGGFAGEGGVGYDFGAFRTELTYVYNRASLNQLNVDSTVINGVALPRASTNSVSGSLNSNSVFLSGYYDIKTGSRWVPYVGAGLGYTNLSTPSLGFSTTINGQRYLFNSNSVNRGLFGWQAKLGLTYVASYNWDVFVEGTYQGSGGFETDRVRYDALNSWGARAGFRYRFAKKEEVVVVPAPAPQPEPAPAPAPQPEPAPAPIRGLW